MSEKLMRHYLMVPVITNGEKHHEGLELTLTLVQEGEKHSVTWWSVKNDFSPAVVKVFEEYLDRAKQTTTATEKS